MSKKPAILLVFILAILAFDLLGHIRGWYNTVWWFDIPMHIAGGAWVTAALFYFARKYGWIWRLIQPKFLNVLGVVLAIGIGWEIFEYCVDIYVLHKYPLSAIPPSILLDSLKDIADDFLGAALMLGFMRKMPFMHKKAYD